jgi:hypothetical protein
MTEQADLGPIERRLRQLIGWRDLLAQHLAEAEAEIAAEARQYANATGVTVRPSLDQLRRQLVTEQKAA